MNAPTRFVKVSRDSVASRREARRASQIRAEEYLKAINVSRPERLFINKNRGILL